MTQQSDTFEPDVPIDTTGALSDFAGDGVIRVEGPADIGLQIDATAQADYAIDVGVRQDDGSIRWFTGEIEYLQADMDTTTISDAWVHVAEYLRLRVTAAAATGETADIYLAEATQ